MNPFSWLFGNKKVEQSIAANLKTLPSSNALGGAIPVEVQGGNSNANMQLAASTLVSAIRSSFVNNGDLAMLREISSSGDGFTAVDEVIKSMFIQDVDNRAIKLNFTRTNSPTATKKRISKIWEDMYDRLDLDVVLPQVLRVWYVEGRCAAHKVRAKEDGQIEALVPLDNENFNKIKLINVDRSTVDMSFVSPDENEGVFYMFTPPQFTAYGNFYTSAMPVIVKNTAICYSDSGIYNCRGEPVSILSRSVPQYVKKVELEVAALVFRISRAPIRNIFFIYTGDKPGTMGKQYFDEQVSSLKSMINGANAGAATGQARLDSIVNNITADLFVPRTTEGNTTQVDQMNGQSTSNIIEELQQANDEYMRSLGVPKSRLVRDGSGGGNAFFNNAAEVSREESQFARDINSLRLRFSKTFLRDLLLDEMTLNGFSKAEATSILSGLNFDWAADESFEALKRLAVLENRIDVLSKANDSGAIGTYVSTDDIFKDVFALAEPDIEAVKETIRGDAWAKELASRNKPTEE